MIANQDLEQLRLLSIFHYVVGAIAGLFACIPVIHFIMGLVLVAGWFGTNESADRGIGLIFMIIAGGFILAGWVYAICLIQAGRFLVRQQHYNYCLVIAAMSCLFTPLGTVLGVFSIIVLMRDSVKELFQQQTSPQTPSGALDTNA